MNITAWAHRFARAASGCAVAAFLLTTTLASPAAAWDARAAEKSTLRVAIIAEQNGKKVFAGHGTGFVIDRGYIATNWHVASPSSLTKANIPFKLYIISTYVPEFTEAETVWTSEQLDLAVLRVKTLNLPVQARFAERAQLALGFLHLPLARLDLGEIEHIVDDVQQVLAAQRNVAEIFAILGRTDGAEHLFRHHLGEADDGVHGRPELVAHMREEFGLAPVRLFGRETSLEGAQPFGI